MADLVKVRDTLRPIEDSEGYPIARSADDLTLFWQWFNESIVVDGLGRPLVVYRGEHGLVEQSTVFQSRLGSLSFGSADAARIYANQPNDRLLDPFVRNARILPVYLRLERPLINEPSDPYVEFRDLSQLLGSECLTEIAKDFSCEIMQTSNWVENFKEFSGPQQVASEAPGRLNDLYFVSYALLDSKKWVERIGAAGFDGAIHCGLGATSCEPEYKVFSPQQAWVISAR